MKNLIGGIDSLALSTEQIIGNLKLYRVETFTVTTRVTYNGAATAGLRLNMYFSPDGKNYDTVPYAYYDINLTAGGTIQETKIVDAPEQGSMMFKVQNLDGTYAATIIKVWTNLEKE